MKRGDWCLGLLFTFAVCVPVLAQQGSSPSHRLIPLSGNQKAPSLADFLSPEYRELRTEYNRLRREMLAQRRSESRRSRSEAATPEPATQPQNSPDRQAPDPAASAADRGTTNATPAIPSGAAEDVAEEIAAVSRALGERLGRALAETLDPKEIPIDPPEMSLAEAMQELKTTIDQGRREARAQYSKALERYKRVWPNDSLPPADWIEKVQPFINQELVRQLADARRELESKRDAPFERTKPGSSVAAPTPLTSKPNSKTSNRMLESVIRRLDKTSTDWLKAATRRGSSQREVAWWKSLAAKSKRQMSTLNRQITQRSRLWRQTSFGVSSRSPNRPGSNVFRTDNGIASSPWLALLIVSLVALGGAGLLVWKRNRQRESSAMVIERVDPRMIRDRESLLRACDQLAFSCLGRPSRFWNHRKVFSLLGQRASQPRPNVEQLSQIYEHARYASDGHLPLGDIVLARKLVAQIENAVRVAA